MYIILANSGTSSLCSRLLLRSTATLSLTLVNVTLEDEIFHIDFFPLFLKLSYTLVSKCHDLIHVNPL